MKTRSQEDEETRRLSCFDYRILFKFGSISFVKLLFNLDKKSCKVTKIKGEIRKKG